MEEMPTSQELSPRTPFGASVRIADQLLGMPSDVANSVAARQLDGIASSEFLRTAVSVSITQRGC
jgi:hypothetical protein